MKIEELKKSLEENLIFINGVIGIGIIKNNGADAVEIAIDKNIPDVKLKIEDLLKGSLWQTQPIVIKETNQINKH